MIQEIITNCRGIVVGSHIQRIIVQWRVKESEIHSLTWDSFYESDSKLTIFKEVLHKMGSKIEVYLQNTWDRGRTRHPL